MRVLISGSRGFIGEALVTRLRGDGHSVTRLVRDKAQASDIEWDAKTGTLDAFAIEGFDAVVHLGGVGLGEKRWTEKERAAIWDSRVESTDYLAQHLARAVNRPKVFVVASGIGFYGDRADEMLSETSTKGEGFLSDVVKNWEEAAEPAVEAGIRTVHLRSGVVLGAAGGMFKRLAPLFRSALGGNLGKGTQYMSWITIDDEVSAIVFAIKNTRVSGAINVCSPYPVTNREFTKTMGKALHRPTFIPVWPWMLKLGFGSQLTEEMLLVSQRAIPKKLENAGFRFQYPRIEDAIAMLAKASAPVPKLRPVDPDDKKKKKSRVPKMLRFEEPPKPTADTRTDIIEHDDTDVIDLDKPQDRG